MKQRFSMECGFLTCLEQGERAELYMERSADGGGLYRGIVWGKSGQLDLGALLPEKNCLVLRRNLPIAELRRKGCWPVLGGRTVLRCSFDAKKTTDGWIPCREPAALFPHDPLLQKSVSACLMKKNADKFVLAMPWQPRRPFPLLPLFCFAHLQKIRGETYLCFFFQSDGSPLPDCESCATISSS